MTFPYRLAVSAAPSPTDLTPTALTPTDGPLLHRPRPARRFGLLGHAPALDGLRGSAVLLVISYHFLSQRLVAGHHVLPGGWAGVDVFFCLSGFLITALILDERRIHGGLGWLGFYARRACRLLPALLLMLTVWLLTLLAFNDQGFLGAVPTGSPAGRVINLPGALVDLAAALGYVANWKILAAGTEAPLGHLWSLSVEEQFYLIWPAVLILLVALRPSRRLLFVGALVTISAALPWVYWNGGAGTERIYFGTDTRAVGLLAGAFCALVWHGRHARNEVGRWAGARAWAGLAVVGWIAVTAGESPQKYLGFLALLALAVSQLVPYLADNRGVLSRLFWARWLGWVGRRSYGLYLWQYVWATWSHPLPFWPGLAVGITGLLLCTELSWRLVERPALRFGRRWARVPH